jgi:hypothetical protein
VVDGEDQFLADCYAKNRHCFSNKPQKLFFLPEHAQELLLLSLGQQLVVQGQQLHLAVSARFKWKVFIQRCIPKALSPVESTAQTLLQVLGSSRPEHLHVLLVNSTLKTAVCGVGDHFMLERLIRGLSLPDADGGVLVGL